MTRASRLLSPALHHASVAPRGVRSEWGHAFVQAECVGQLIHRHYIEATFQVEPGDDPTGMYAFATVDVEDTDVVVEVYIDRLLDLQIDEGLAEYVVPVRPLARVQIS